MTIQPYTEIRVAPASKFGNTSKCRNSLNATILKHLRGVEPSTPTVAALVCDGTAASGQPCSFTRPYILLPSLSQWNDQNPGDSASTAATACDEAWCPEIVNDILSRAQNSRVRAPPPPQSTRKELAAFNKSVTDGFVHTHNNCGSPRRANVASRMGFGSSVGTSESRKRGRSAEKRSVPSSAPVVLPTDIDDPLAKSSISVPALPGTLPNSTHGSPSSADAFQPKRGRWETNWALAGGNPKTGVTWYITHAEMREIQKQERHEEEERRASLEARRLQEERADAIERSRLMETHLQKFKPEDRDNVRAFLERL